MTTQEIKTDKSQLYAGIIWVVSAAALAIYGTILFFNSRVPGIAELINFLSHIDEKYVYVAAPLSIFIEGLYFIGSFFPGSGLIMIIAIISGASGYGVFLITLFLIFIGWSLAGVVNIYLAKVYRSKILKLHLLDEYHIKDSMWTTWFPAFRSSYEVAQVIEGGHPIKVFLSSLRVRFVATLFVGALALIIPLLFNIHNSTDQEGFLVISIVFFISLIVGLKKIKEYYLFKPGKVKQEQKSDISNIYYTAYFVDNPAELLQRFPPKHKNVYAHHSTNTYKPESLEGVAVGHKTKLKILGRVYDETCDALMVENSKSKNSHPHITLSCVDGVPPVSANSMLEHATLEQTELFYEPVYVDVTEGYVVKKDEMIIS